MPFALEATGVLTATPMALGTRGLEAAGVLTVLTH